MSEEKEKKAKAKKPAGERLWEFKMPIPPEPLRITEPGRKRIERIKIAPPPEPTRKVKPKEKKKE